MVTLRNLLQAKVGNLTDEEYYLLLDLATDDIRINRLMWGKKTTMPDLIQIVKICVIVLDAIKNAA